ncbi:very short patch repair endonuclease [Corynebacterium sanguinis]|nr:very short patch repair endonuclease [Corynebacterium sanguinis]
MPSRNTAPELLLRKELFRRGLGFRVNVNKLPGSPDIVFPKQKIAVFVDGCYWHGCEIHSRPSVHNREWWIAKMRRNHERDTQDVRDLEVAGWWVIRAWEHDDFEDVADEIEWLWRGLRQG